MISNGNDFIFVLKMHCENWIRSHFTFTWIRLWITNVFLYSWNGFHSHFAWVRCMRAHTSSGFSFLHMNKSETEFDTTFHINNINEQFHSVWWKSKLTFSQRRKCYARPMQASVVRVRMECTLWVLWHFNTFFFLLFFHRFENQSRLIVSEVAVEKLFACPI